MEEAVALIAARAEKSGKKSARAKKPASSAEGKKPAAKSRKRAKKSEPASAS